MEKVIIKDTSMLESHVVDLFDNGNFMSNGTMFVGFRDNKHFTITICGDGSALINRENCVSVMMHLTRQLAEVGIFPYFYKDGNFTRMWLYNYE